MSPRGRRDLVFCRCLPAPRVHGAFSAICTRVEDTLFSHTCLPRAWAQTGKDTWATQTRGLCPRSLMFHLTSRAEGSLEANLEKTKTLAEIPATFLFYNCSLSPVYDATTVGGRSALWIWARSLQLGKLIDVIWFQKKPEYLLLSSHKICRFHFFLFKVHEGNYMLCDITVLTFHLLKDLHSNFSRFTSW